MMCSHLLQCVFFRIFSLRSVFQPGDSEVLTLPFFRQQEVVGSSLFQLCNKADTGWPADSSSTVTTPKWTIHVLFTCVTADLLFF